MKNTIDRNYEIFDMICEILANHSHFLGAEETEYLTNNLDDILLLSIGCPERIHHKLIEKVRERNEDAIRVFMFVIRKMIMLHGKLNGKCDIEKFARQRHKVDREHLDKIDGVIERAMVIDFLDKFEEFKIIDSAETQKMRDNLPEICKEYIFACGISTREEHYRALACGTVSEEMAKNVYEMIENII